MNSPDPFEKRLARTPLRPAPASLRREVLQAATVARVDRAQGASHLIRAWLADWLWPRPLAWGTLGFAWVIIVLLNLAAFDSADSAPRQHVQRRVSPALTAALREQRALRDSLLHEPPAPALPLTPRPGAQLRPGGSRLQLGLT